MSDPLTRHQLSRSGRLVAHDAGRRAGHHGRGGDISGDDGTGADRRPLANGDPTQYCRVRSDRSPPAYPCRFRLPVVALLQLAGIGRRTGKTVVDEHHAVTDEDFVFYCHSLANERVGRYLAARPDFCTGLNFDKGPDHGLVADDATVEVDELGLGNAYPLAELNVLANRHPVAPYTDLLAERTASAR